MSYELKRDVADDEINLRELFEALWKSKLIILAVTLVFAVGSVIYALNLPDLYKAEVLLAPADEDAGSMTIPGQLGSIASLASINLGGGSASKTNLALAVLNSKKFKMDFIERHQILPDLMAAKEWNSVSNQILYDEKLYNPKEGRWVGENNSSNSRKPSLQKAIKIFGQLLATSDDKGTGFVNLAIEHVSPHIARQWVEWLVRDLNENMRAREKEESAKSIAYLESQLEKTQLSDVKQVLFELIEEQTKTYMFTEVRDEYIFKTIDPAIVPESKSGPARATICVLGTLLGGFISIGFVLIRFMFVNIFKDSN